jgi:2-amino-4-hydroxy-6-hydroxymethyldihydropteridine diphosphokinase
MPGEPACYNLPIEAEVYIGLGTNLGDRADNLRNALGRLGRVVDINAVSRVYETEPVGFRDQPDFWNLVVKAQTTLEPDPLYQALKQIERELGRTESFRNAPRIIDLDVIAYDRLVLNAPNLQIPHPRMHERSFVLYPLAEVAPEFRHPASSLTVTELIERLEEPTQAIALENALTMDRA